MKNYIYTLLLLPMFLFVVTSCDKYEESNINNKEVTFIFGINEESPYASEITVSNEAQVKNSVVIISNQEWEIIGNGEEAWYGLYNDETKAERIYSGSGNKVVFLDIQSNKGLEKREAELIFKLSPSGIEKTYKIIQEPDAPKIQAEKSVLFYEYNITEGNVNVNSNVPADIRLGTDGCGWIKVLTGNGVIGDFELKFKMEPNNGKKERECFIILGNESYNVADTILVRQKPNIPKIVLNNNFKEPINSSNKSEKITWDNGQYSGKQIISLLSSKDNTVLFTETNESGNFKTEFDVSDWIAKPENREKYGNELIDLVFDVKIEEADVPLAAGTFQFNPFFPYGKGTIEAPYEIYNYIQLNSIRYWLDKCYILKNDIVISDAVATPFDVLDYKYFTGRANFLPIGVCGDSGTPDDLPFTGVFDGNGKNISGLELQSTGNTVYSYGIGLFGTISGKSSSSMAVVKNLTVDGTITAEGKSFIAGIVGKVNDYSAIENCINEVNITVDKITNNFANATSIGGVVGQLGNFSSKNTEKYGNNTNRPLYNSNVKLIGCVNRGEITVEDALLGIGGVAGSASGIIEKCGNIGKLTIGTGASKNVRVGGLVGNFSGHTIKESFNKGNLNEGFNHMGGLVGWIIPATTVDKVLIENSYNSGEIIKKTSTGTANISGILGAHSNFPCEIKNCHNYGKITSKNTPIGNAISALENSIDCFALSESASVFNGAKQLSADEMKTSSNFSNWDFQTIWDMGENYPILRNIKE